jgi:hypothetical protein
MCCEHTHSLGANSKGCARAQIENLGAYSNAASCARAQRVQTRVLHTHSALTPVNVLMHLTNALPCCHVPILLPFGDFGNVAQGWRGLKEQQTETHIHSQTHRHRDRQISTAVIIVMCRLCNLIRFWSSKKFLAWTKKAINPGQCLSHIIQIYWGTEIWYASARKVFYVPYLT